MRVESNINLRLKECRLLFQNKEYEGFELLEVEDRALAHHWKKITITLLAEKNIELECTSGESPISIEKGLQKFVDWYV